MDFNIVKQRNTLGLIAAGMLLLICFLLFRLATSVSEGYNSELAAGVQHNADYITDSLIRSVEEEWRLRILQSNDSIAKSYQEMLDKANSRTIAIVKWRTEYRDTGSVKTFVEYCDTGSVQIFTVLDSNLVLRTEYHDEWLDLSVTATVDSSEFSVMSRDSVLVIFRDEKQGFLKPRKTVAYLYNTSPYTQSQTQAFQAIIVPKRPGLLMRIINRIFHGKS